MDGELFIPIIAIIGFFGSLITFVYMRYKTLHEQRMALIDSGQSAGIFAEKRTQSSGLRTGLFFIGVGIGFVIGMMLEQFLRFPDATGVIPMCLIGGGLGLVIHHKMVKNERSEDLDELTSYSTNPDV